MRFCMDWHSVTFDWNRARAFLVTAEEGSLSAAARALGLAQPTLSRQVEAFQQELGITLFERFGRGLELTPAGTALLDHARAMGEAAHGLSIAAAGQGGQLAGPVTLSASDAYAGLLLPPLLKRLKAQEPGVTIRVLADNAASDLLRREADIAIRNFRPEEADLVARKLSDAGANFYAAKGYIETHGQVEAPEDWARMHLVIPGEGADFRAGIARINPDIDQAETAVECSSYLAMWEMVKQGLGVGLLDARLGDREPAVARVAPHQPDIPFPVWLVSHRDLLLNARLRMVFDFLAEALG